MNWIEAGLIMWALVNTLGVCLGIIFTRTMGIVVTQETDKKVFASEKRIVLELRNLLDEKEQDAVNEMNAEDNS